MKVLSTLYPNPVPLMSVISASPNTLRLSIGAKAQLYPHTLSRAIASPAHQRARIDGSTSKFKIAARAFSGR